MQQILGRDQGSLQGDCSQVTYRLTQTEQEQKSKQETRNKAKGRWVKLGSWTRLYCRELMLVQQANVGQSRYCLQGKEGLQKRNVPRKYRVNEKTGLAVVNLHRVGNGQKWAVFFSKRENLDPICT